MPDIAAVPCRISRISRRGCLVGYLVADDFLGVLERHEDLVEHLHLALQRRRRLGLLLETAVRAVLFLLNRTQKRRRRLGLLLPPNS